jgi:hypothetical protein
MGPGRRQAGGPAVARHPKRPAFADLTPGGAWLFVKYITGDAFRWDVRLETWRRRACAVAGRELTRDEWARFAPDRPYAPRRPA